MKKEQFSCFSPFQNNFTEKSCLFSSSYWCTKHEHSFILTLNRKRKRILLKDLFSFCREHFCRKGTFCFFFFFFLVQLFISHRTVCFICGMPMNKRWWPKCNICFSWVVIDMFTIKKKKEIHIGLHVTGNIQWCSTFTVNKYSAPFHHHTPLSLEDSVNAFWWF